jgi:hypothetical protein
MDAAGLKGYVDFLPFLLRDTITLAVASALIKLRNENLSRIFREDTAGKNALLEPCHVSPVVRTLVCSRT